jgi:hypothetical protein
MTDKEDTPLPAEIERRKRLAKLIGQRNAIYRRGRAQGT